MHYCLIVQLLPRGAIEVTIVISGLHKQARLVRIRTRPGQPNDIPRVPSTARSARPTAPALARENLMSLLLEFEQFVRDDPPPRSITGPPPQPPHRSPSVAP